MAFNFRPTKSQQILNKKKPLAEEAAAVHEYVMSSYVTSVLIPCLGLRTPVPCLPRLHESSSSCLTKSSFGYSLIKKNTERNSLTFEDAVVSLRAFIPK